MKWPRRNWAVVEYAPGSALVVARRWTHRGALRLANRYRLAVSLRRQPGWPQINYEVSRGNRDQ